VFGCIGAGAAAAVLMVAVLVGAARPAAAAEARPGVVFVAVPGLRWATAPAALDAWAKASLALRTADRQRRLDVYLTIGKGRRTGGPDGLADAGPLERTGAGGALRQWPALVRHDRRLRFGGRLGELGRQLAGHGVAYAVVARFPDGTAAALGADDAGRVPRFTTGGPAEARAALRDAALVMVESEAADLEAVLQATTGACRVVATGSLPDDESHLGVIAVSPECGLGRGGLVSPSTRQAGFVTLPDLTPTLLSLVGVLPPDIFEGGAVRAAPALTRPGLVDEDRRAAVGQDAGAPFAAAFVLAAALGLAGLVRERLRLPLAAVLLGMPAALLLAMLVPWWRAGGATGGALHAGIAVAAGLAVLLGVAGLLAVAATKAARRHPPTVVLVLTVVTVVVIAVDALRNGMLELDAPMVNNAIGAGRFAGVGNVPYGFLAGAALVAAGLTLDRYGHRALPGVAAALALVVVVDAAPMFGADVGGLLSTVPAVAVLLAGRRGRAARRAAVLVGAALACAAVAGLVALELSRPAGHQTHLGRAVAGGSMLQTAVRRGLSSLHSFVTSPWVIVALLAGAGLVAVRRRLDANPALRAAGAALAVAAVLGSALNDSGVAVGGAVLFVAWGAALALAQPGDGGGETGPAATAAASAPSARL
jgi:hypothetical protein